MPVRWIAALALAFFASQAGAEKPQAVQEGLKATREELQTLKTDNEKTNYALGADLAKNLRQFGIEIDLDVLIRGLKDGFSGENLLMTPQEIAANRAALQRELNRQSAERKKKIRKGVPGGDK